MVSLALSGAWLMRLPADADYLTDLLPAFLLAGVAVGLASVSVQISASSGVSESAAGLASGLVETMRDRRRGRRGHGRHRHRQWRRSDGPAVRVPLGLRRHLYVRGARAVLSAVGFRPQRDHVPVHHELDVSVAAKPAA
jgi:hypothetical protein